MSIANIEPLESTLRKQLHDPLDPFSTPLDYQAETQLRLNTLSHSAPLSIVVGMGPGGITAIDRLSRAGHHVLAFEADNTPSGKLPLVSPEKGLHTLGLLESFQVLARSNVHAYLNAVVSSDGVNEGISLPELVTKSQATEVFFGTGTRERHTYLLDGADIGDYRGHAYAYELIGQMNKWITQGKNLADFPLDFDPSGEAVVISGAGLVALEDMGKLILAYQIAIQLKERGIDLTQQENPFAQLKLASQPLTTLINLYKESSEAGAKIREWLGDDLSLSGQEAAITLLSRLHERGIKKTLILYRRSESEHVKENTSVKLTPSGEPDNRLTKDQLKGLSRVGGYQILYNREPGSVTLNADRISTLKLIERNYHSADRSSYTEKESLRPALVISALGGASPTINLHNNQKLTPGNITTLNNVTYSVIGNAVSGKGNRAASIAATNEVFKNLPTRDHQIYGDVVSAITYLDTLGYAPANVILNTLNNLPTLVLQKLTKAITK